MAGEIESVDELGDDEQEALETLLFRLADDEFVFAERYTEWQVRAPTLESDLALSNNAQDELGHARLWYDVLEDLGHEEHELVYEREPENWRHSTLVEQEFPEGGWADAILRHYLYDVASRHSRSPVTPRSPAASARSRTKSATTANTPRAGWNGWPTARASNSSTRPLTACSHTR